MEHNYLSEFENPSADFRGKPFWAWNCKLNREQLLEQLDYFKEMGMGGVTIHCRTGLDTEYLGEEFLSNVKACLERAKELDMKVCLYDEDRWPSGFGGGIVTKDKSYRSRYLVFTPFQNKDRSIAKVIETVGSTAGEKTKGNGNLLARYEVKLINGLLVNYRRLEENEDGENVWYAYLEISEESPWYNNQTYVNTLDKKAIERFIEVTHEKYYETVGVEFGNSIPSIFTDEPQFVHKTTLGKAEEKRDVIIPYTDDFEDTYQNQYGRSFLDHLPEVFWELESQEASVTRYHYHDHIAERFATAFSDTIGTWCKKHGIKLTGHMMEEPTLRSQTQALGEAMRHYRGFDIPGIDMLCDWREYSTAKQAQSAAHQMNSNQVTSELYGVTNWDFDFKGHKLQGDFQAALGVTERVHHLSWVSMAGEAKRDYPASIFYQSPWYQKYGLIEDYFARVNTALRSGKPSVKVGVIHPIESYWLYFGPQEQTELLRNKMEKQFTEITEWLLFGLIDFDYISESLMVDLKDLEDDKYDKFAVGKMNYEVVIVPGCITLRSSTMKRLRQFVEHGGKVIFVGEIANYVDAVPSEEPKKLSMKAITTDYEQNNIINLLQEDRQVDMIDEAGIRADSYLCQVREVGEDRIVFLAKGKKVQNIGDTNPITYEISLKGEFEVTELVALTGKQVDLLTLNQDGRTIIEKKLYEEDSVLLYLKPKKEQNNRIQIITDNVESNITKNRKAITTGSKYEAQTLSQITDYALSEPNVLMLDQAMFGLDDENLRESEEVLRIDNILRTELGYPLKMDALAQPWVDDLVETAVHTLTLRYVFNSEIEVREAKLALEDAAKACIVLNGQQVESTIDGYYVDLAIKTFCLPNIKKGSNELLISIPYESKTNVEWCYIVGNFGVEVQCNQSRIVAKPEKINFSDLTSQRFPFYGGNLIYKCDIDVMEGDYEMEISEFCAPLLSVILDGAEVGTIAFSPYRVSLGNLSGKHSIEIISYGNRVNTFGPVHLDNNKEVWIGPNAWRSEGTAFSYDYRLKRTGILSAPKLYRV